MHSDSYPSDRAPGLEKDLEPFEWTKAICNIQKLYGIKTNAELTKLLGISEQTIIKAMKYLEIPSQITERVTAGSLDARKAKELTRLDTEKERVEKMRSESSLLSLI